MFDVVNKLCVGDIFLESDVFTKSQSSETVRNAQKHTNLHYSSIQHKNTPAAEVKKHS